MDESYTADAVARGVGLESFAEDRELQAADRGARILFRPAFHPECALTAIEVEGATTISLHTARTNLWYWWGSAEGTSASRPSPPALWREAAEVSTHRAHAFWTGVEVLDFSSTPSRTLGVDGMTVNGVLTRGPKVAAFEIWSPEPPSPAHQYAAALWSLADDSLRQEENVRLLEQLHRYLGLGLPVKVVRGAFTTIRLFGALSTHDESGLRSTLGQVRSDVPVLMDMTNLDGMGTRLHALFAEFAERKGSTAWVASRSALDHLAAIGVPSVMIFEDRDAAAAWLMRPC